ncbi:MAG: translin family protein [Thermoplasmata archaeon]
MTSGSPPSGNSVDPTRGRIPETIVAGIEAHLRQRELRREELYQRARKLRRLSQGTMIRLHEGAAVAAELSEIRSAMAELADWVRREGRGDENLAFDALQEGVEATLLGSVVRNERLPGPADLGVEPEAYLLGLGDLVGEVRRLALESLAHDRLPQAETYLATMEGLYHTLMRFDTTRAIVPLKPKQDVARALVERTRGEVVMARMLARVHLPGATVPEGTP